MSTSTTASTTKTATRIVRPDAGGTITIPSERLAELGVGQESEL